MREVRRIIHLRFLLAAVVLLLINGLLISSSAQDAELSKTYDEMIQIAVSKQDAGTNREAATLAWKQYFAEHGIVGGHGVEKTDEMATAESAREMLLTSADYLDGFQEAVQEKRESASRLAGSDIYEKGSFEHTNLLKTRYDLGKLENLEVSLGNGIWLEKLYGHSYIQIFALLLLFATVYSFFAERKTGLYQIVHLAGNGRARLFFKRCILLSVEALVIHAVFYLESALLLLQIHGGMEGVHLPAAGSETFLLTAGTLSRAEFVGVMVLMSTITTVALSLVLWFVLSFFSNVNMGITFYLVICVADWLLHLFVPFKSAFRALHYINIYYLLYPNQALRYSNWGNSLGISSVAMTTVIFAAVAGIAALLLNLYVTVRKYFTGNANGIEKFFGRVLDAFMRLMGKLPIGCMELYKVLVSQKAVLILAVLLYLAGQMYVGPMVLYDVNKSYMSMYYEKADGLGYSLELEAVYGEFAEECESNERAADPADQLAQLALQSRRDMLAGIRENVDYVKAMSEAGVEVVVLMPYEYEAALGAGQGAAQRLLALINVLAVVVIACGYISYEKKSEVHRLALACSERRRWLIRKYSMNLLLTAIFALLSYGIYYKKLFDVYRMDNLSAPLRSLPMFRDLACNPSIGTFLILDLLMKIILLWSLSAIVCFLSVHVKYLYCLLAGLVVAVPQLLCMIGFRALDDLSVGKYLAFLPCVYEGTPQTLIYCIFAVLLILVGAAITIHLFRSETVRK